LCGSSRLGRRKKQWSSNLFKPDTEGLRLISDAANQTHLKLLIVNNQSGEVNAFIEFDNTFGLDALALTVSIVVESKPKGDFSEAVRYALDTRSTSDLVRLSALA